MRRTAPSGRPPPCVCSGAVRGLKLARRSRLKAEPRTADIPILIVIFWPEAERGARAAGCDGFLLKPVPISELWETADRLLARRASDQLG